MQEHVYKELPILQLKANTYGFAYDNIRSYID